MLKALAGLVARPPLTGLFGQGIRRTIASGGRARTEGGLGVSPTIRPVFTSGLIASALFRSYGEGLGYRKYYFMKPRRVKGQMSYKGLRTSRGSWKLSVKRNRKQYKMKTVSSMKKRVGPRHDRKFKVIRSGYVHLRRNKSSNNLRRAKRVKYIHKADEYRVRVMLPYWKNKKFKMTL